MYTPPIAANTYERILIFIFKSLCLCIDSIVDKSHVRININSAHVDTMEYMYSLELSECNCMYRKITNNISDARDIKETPAMNRLAFISCG